LLDMALPLLGGLLALLLGGELLVRGASRVAEALRVSPLVIGLTLVGFGTSTPELVASIQASLRDAPGIAVGNIVGSNIANLLLILGLSAVVAPIRVGSAELRRDGGVMIASAVAYALIGALWGTDRVVGAALVLALVAYLGWVLARELGRQGGASIASTPAVSAGSVAVSVVIALAGLAFVIVGGGWFVDGAIVLARHVGLSEAAIGLTVVAIGTSLPELVTSVVAAARGKSDLAFGNVVGSNIYNVLGIGGVTALVAPSAFPVSIATIDAPLMVGVSVLAVLLAWSGRVISRLEGAVLLVLHVAWMGWALSAGSA
jgi:cation:H+ antiporter